MTANELAEAVGLSPSTVSQIEPGGGPVSSVASSHCPSPGYADLLGNAIPRHCGEKGPATRLSSPDHAATYELVTPDLNRRLEMLFTSLDPGTSSSDQPLPHAGDECLVILQGEAEVSVADRRYVLLGRFCF
jgi:hypothetical protein